jgi:MFS-type transporter involved in bile tolerance (Atg22 family)
MGLVLASFFLAYYVYEPPYRGLYPDCLPDRVYGRAQGVQHVLRGAAIGGALVGGGYLLSVWQPLPFVLAAGVSTAACAAVVWLVHEPASSDERHPAWLESLRVPLRIVRREANVRRFLIANTAWETTFAGMRTFVVLYIIRGLDQPKGTASLVLGTVALGYVVAAATSARFGDRFGMGAVILGASVVYGIGLFGAGLARHWHVWYYAPIALVAVAGGTVMTLAWGLLFKIMPRRDRGAITGLATMTKGLGLIVGPLGVGAVIDNLKPLFRSTNGYAAMWPAVAIPVLAVIPLVTLLADEERRRSANPPTRTAMRPAP